MQVINKVDKEFVINSFVTENTLHQYSAAVTDIGLWESEKVFFRKHLSLSGSILDIGCGAGRTTFGLHTMGYKNNTWLDLCRQMIKEAKIHCEKGLPHYIKGSTFTNTNKIQYNYI